MSTKYTQAFKQQAIQKALNRDHDVKFDVISNALGVANSTPNLESFAR